MSENDISIFTEVEGRMRSFETDDIFGLPDRPIEHVYLVQSGVVSLMVQLRSGDQIETGMVGPGGLIGACVLGRAPWSNVFVAQSPVCAWEMRTEDFIAAAKRDPKLHDLAFRHVQWLMVQAQQTAACNGAHHLQARLATWLLRAHDLTGWTEIPFTQNTISRLLAMKRPSISMAMGELYPENVVSYSRGKLDSQTEGGLKSALASVSEPCGRADMRSSEVPEDMSFPPTQSLPKKAIEPFGLAHKPSP